VINSGGVWLWKKKRKYEFCVEKKHSEICELNLRSTELFRGGEKITEQRC
jgi:hypothetical protein